MIKFNKKIVEDINTLYHGSGDKFTNFNKEINWLTSDYNYAKYYALSLRDDGYIYECSTSLNNLFDMGKTGFRVYDLLPLKVPYNRSQKFLISIKELNLSSEELTQLLDEVTKEWNLEANGYKMLCSTVVRSKAFKKVLMSRGYRGIKALEFNKLTNEYVDTYGIFNGNEIKIKSIKEVNVLTEENKAITWGDLDIAKKTDTRKMMGGRGTGHFGTGFYFVGANGPYGINGNKFYDYAPDRPIYEIDLDRYNLYKPKDNDTAYKIHDAMRNINNYYSDDAYSFLFKNYDEDKLKDELYNVGWEAQKVYEDFDEDDLDLDDLEDIVNDLEDDSSESQDAKDKAYEKKYRELVLDFINKYELEGWISNYYQDSLQSWLNDSKLGEIEKSIEKAIDNKLRCVYYVEYAIDTLSKIFNIDKNKLLAMIKSFDKMSSDETISTLLFKELGYEGVDVTHLNKDAQGLSGLDNFSYGTVIYDLKPGTFRRIKEPRKESLIEKIVKLSNGKWQVQSEKGRNMGTYDTKAEAEKRLKQIEYFKHINEEELKEYLDKVDNYSGTDIYMTDDVYQLKNILLKGDKPYRIYYWNGDYCFCNALGDMTHNGMMKFLFDKGYANAEGFDEWADENYMVFIPKNFDTDLMTYDTSLGSDNYYYCRVYNFGVMFVRDPYTYDNSLFDALGTPLREISYDSWDDLIYIIANGNKYVFNLEKDLNYNMNNAFTIELTPDKINKVDEELELNEAKEDRQKFIDWYVKSTIEEEEKEGIYNGDEDSIRAYGETIVDEFIKLKSKIKSPYNDFYYWIKNASALDLDRYIDGLHGEIKAKEKVKQKEKDGARLVYSDDNWKVYEITTYEASAKYGKGTKWCISGSKRWANGEEGARYFDQYYSQDGVKFYFFINKDTKYALAVYPNNACEIFNAEDVGIPYIPNAPVIDEIKADYRNESDSNILVNAIMNKKLPNDVLKRIIQETYEDNVGYSCTIFDRNEVNDLITEVDDMIPDGYLEYEACANGNITPETYTRLTGEEFDDSLDYWDGDLPALATYELDAIAGDTKEEKLKSLRYTLENEAEYVVLEENYDGWSITPLKDYTELFMWANNRCGISDWSDGEVDDFFINSLDANELEHVHGGRLYVFPIMLANRLIWDIKNGEISSNVLNGLGLSNDYIKSLSENLKEDLSTNIISFVEKEIGTSDTPVDGPSYILPNGKFLTIWKSKIPVSKYSASGNATHRDVQQFLYDKGLVKEDGWIDDPDLEKLGCIRVNAGFEEYIWLPDKRPNERQWDSLLVWLDWYFRFHSKITVGYYHYAPKTYWARDYTTDEILKKCKEAYGRGYLTESIKDIKQEILDNLDKLNDLYSDYYIEDLKNKNDFNVYVWGKGVSEFDVDVLVNKKFIRFKSVHITNNAQNKGIAMKLIDAILSTLEDDWTIEIVANINASFWNHIASKYIHFKWIGLTDVDESLVEKIVKKGNKWQDESLNEDKVLKLPKEATNKMIDNLKGYYKDIHLEVLPIDKLVKDNDLLNDDDLQSYHQGEWEHKKAVDFHLNDDKINNMRASIVPFVIKKKDGRLLISDGRHRTRAAYNDGYTHVEYPTYEEK